MSKDRTTLWWLAPVVAAVLLVTPLPAGMIEAVYSRGLFRIVQTTLTTISNLTPFAWLDVWLSLAVLLSARRILALVRARGVTGPWRALAEAGRRALHTAGIVAIVFLFCWGLNYRRVPLEEALNVSAPTPATADELADLLIEANALAARLRPEFVQHPVTYAEAAEALRDPFERALGELGQPALGAFGRPKYTLLTPYFTWAGINGMLDPFALESIVHPDALPFERPFILAHEWGHLAGRADEAEASAVGWVACMDGDDSLAYSATVFLVVELADALPSSRWRALLPTLDPGLRDDLRALAIRWARAQPVVQRASSRVYDEYLRANRVEDGVKSYSRALHLILLPPLRRHVSDDLAARSRPR
jgi:hypothetical protein